MAAIEAGSGVKLCECGCGEPARIATATRPKDGYVKGQSLRFKAGHWRPRLVGYRTKAVIREGRESLVGVHRLRAERALGKPLPPLAVVHHADGSKDPNAPLVICQDKAYHNFLHRRMRVKAAGGDPNRDRWCAVGQHVRPVDEFRRSTTRPDGLQTGCRACHNRLRVERKRRARQRHVA